MDLLRSVERLVDRLERSESLDRPSELATGVLQRALASRRLRDVLSGTPLGHPLHPTLVAVPIGSWSAATCLDLTGGSKDAARWLVGFGTLTALPTAVSGANDWLTTSGSERRVGLAHASLNYLALLLYAGSWVARGRDQSRRASLMSLAGAASLAGAGWLGGHLVYGMGVGVDTTSFQHFPDEWTDVAAESDIPELKAILADAGGVPVLLARSDGRIVAIADRCTHRGGPLHDGDVSRGCVTCPWHGSVFRLVDGTVAAGPASRPQPVLEVRVVDERAQVRRSSEARSLRTNPVGV